MDRIRAADRPWSVLRQAIKLHVMVYRATRGLLDHVGAKSAVKRTTPLVYVSDGENIVIVASKGGDPRHPSWFHNLRAHPDVAVQIGSRRRPVRAHVADPQERARLWPKALEVYPGYEGYQARTAREIPLVILRPRG
jgi:deazaflavin-dependent oxidoreductase (nitroreductase family)